MWTSLVGGLEHFLLFHILGIFIPTDFHIFQRGWNHQPAEFANVNIAVVKKKECSLEGSGGYFRYGIHCWVSQQPQINWAPTISLCLAGRPIYQGFMALFWDVLSRKFLCASFFAKLEISEDLFFPPHFPSSSHIFPTFSPDFPQVFPRFPSHSAAAQGGTRLGCRDRGPQRPQLLQWWGDHPPRMSLSGVLVGAEATTLW